VEDVDWLHLTQDRDQWGVVMNMVTKLLVPKNAGNFFIE